MNQFFEAMSNDLSALFRPRLVQNHRRGFSQTSLGRRLVFHGKKVLGWLVVRSAAGIHFRTHRRSRVAAHYRVGLG